MQFPFDCEELFNTDKDGFVILKGKELSGYAGFNSYTNTVKFKQGQKHFDKSSLTGMDKLCAIVDKLGCASATVDFLNPVTRSVSNYHVHEQIRRQRPENIFEDQRVHCPRSAQGWSQRSLLQRVYWKMQRTDSSVRVRLLRTRVCAT